MFNLWKVFCALRFNQLEKKFYSSLKPEQLELWPKLLTWGKWAGIYKIGKGIGGGVNSATFFPYDTRTGIFWWIDGFIDSNPINGGHVVTDFARLENVPPGTQVPRHIIEMVALNDSKKASLGPGSAGQIGSRVTIINQPLQIRSGQNSV